jgi:hypothetical protein
MSTPATYDDVNLILRLYEMRREPRMREARAWFVKNFKPKSLEEANQIAPPGSDENAYVRMVTTYWEMVGSFLTSGVLNEELFFQSGRELLLVYVRSLPILADLRKAFNDPGAYKNLETVAKRYIDYLNRVGPGSFEAFAARVGG